MKPAVMPKACLLAAIVLHLLAVTEGDKSCSEPCLIYSATSEINAIELSTTKTVHLVPNLQRAVALDVHVREKTFYWSDINLRVIKRMNMSSGIIEDIITDNLGTVDGLAVEWESHLIYWADYSNSSIEVAWLDGSNRKLLFIEEVSKPRGIALYPKKGLMFWTDWGSTPKIERASLAGLGRTVLVDLTNSSQFWPVAIFVDYTKDRVYWIDAYSDVIDSTDLNGQNRRKLSDRVHPTRNILPFDFTVYGDTLYWSDWYTDTIEKLNWTTAEYLGGFGVLTSDRVFGLALLDQSSQPASAGNHLCKINNGGCSHLCLLTPDGFVCACPDGIPLLPDGKNCLTDFTRFFLFAEGRNLRQLQLHVSSNSSLRIPLKEQTSSPMALDYNYLDEKVYWTDVAKDTISRAFLNGSSQETIVSTRLRGPYGLAVDSFGQNIYWTDTYEDVIEVASSHGLYRRVLIKDDLQSPRDIALDVTRGFMYWTDWGLDERIEKADMDGANRAIVIRTGIYFPNGLALDVDKNWLYWVDGYYEKLEVYEFPSERRREIISSQAEAFLSFPLGLALYGNHLYWTDRYWKGIYRADRETGENAEIVVFTQSRPALIHAYDKNITITPVTNQCNINNGGCSHLCLLTPVGSKCSCSDEFILQDDKKSCHKLPPQPFLLFADATYGRIRKVTSQDSGSLTSLPIENIISRPVALAYDIVDDRVYWTDVTRKTISRAFLNGSSQEVIHDTQVKTPDGLAVDIIGRNLYWTDMGSNRIEVSKLNGSYRMALVTSDIDNPRDIILDVSKALMYWTDWGSSPKIEKAEMTGKQRVVIVNSGLQVPNGLTLDCNKNRLYWVDGRTNKLEYLDLNQNNRVTLISSYYVLPYPFGLTVLGDHLYWTDWQRYAVYRADKETGGSVTRFVTGIGQPMDIHGYNVTEYSTSGNSSCQWNNGGCSHICLLSSTGGECACPNHLTLSGDGTTCKRHVPQKFLLFADATDAEIFVLPLDGSNAEPKPVPMALKMYRPVALGLDIIENRIYWTDVTLNTISRAFINGSSAEVIVSDNVYSPDGLAVDPLGRNIYWTDTGTNKIEISRMNGTMRKILISQNLDEPRDIILDLHNGTMYWCDWGEEHKIESAHMNGEKRRLLVKRGLYWPNGLTLGDKNRKLYWVDAWFHTLEYYDLELHTITTLSKDSSILPHPFGLTLFEDYLYWTDWSLDVVYQAEKNALPNATVRVSGLSQPMDIHAYDRNITLPGHPCSLSNGGCSHLCLLTPDGHHCSCPDGLSLSEDEKTCIPHTYVFQKFLLFADASQAEIYVLPLDGSSSGAIALPIGQNMYRPVALGLDITENRIYWTDVSWNRISRAFINGSSPEIIVSVNVFTPDGLAVDPLGRNVYWTDTGSNKIEVSRMDGTMRKTLIDQDLDQPRDIILDLNKGLMYWCDWGVNPKIEIANMDGNSRRVLVKRGLYWPNGLTLDDIDNKLYWVDAFLDLLEYYDLERHTIATLLEDDSILLHPFGLTSLDDHLYWTDWYKDAVYQTDKKTASDAKVLVSGLSQPMDVHAYDRNKTLPDHPCSSSYGGCTHLCLLRPDGYFCSCPDHLQSGEVCSSSVVLLPSSSAPINTASTFVSSVTPAPPRPTIVKSSSASIESASTSVSKTKAHLFATVSSYNPSISSSPTSVFNPPSSTEQRPTVSSTSVTPTPLSPTECRPNTCKNGGTCVVPGYFCECQKYYVWNRCVVYVGASAVEIELSFPNQKQWIEFHFKAAVAKACTNFFCKSGECKSKSGRVKRSAKANYFQVSDVKILGLSSGGENTWKVEFAVLFPSVDGQAPRPSPPNDLVQMVNEDKENFEKAVGGTFKRITIGKQSEQPKGGEKSTQDKGTSAVPIAAGVATIIVVMIIVVAFVIYRMRRKRRPNNRHADDIQLGSDWVTNTNSHTAFDNPTFGQDPTYDSISTATGASVAEKIRHVNEENESNGIGNPTYGVAFSDTRYGSLQEVEELQKREEKDKDAVKDDDYIKPVDSQSEFPQRVATGDDEDYEKIKCESHA